MHNHAKPRIQAASEQKAQIKPEAKPSSGRRFLMVLGALAVFGLGGIAGASLLSYRQGTPVAGSQQDSQVAGSGIPAGVSLTSWQNNGRGGRYVMRVIEGSVPAGAQLSGVVTSDTDCDADAQGLSHCHNGITLSNGARITAVNSHNMMRFQCLDPGQRVSITRLDGGWIIAKT